MEPQVAAEPVPMQAETMSWRRQWWLHLWSFLLPLINMVFLVLGPHGPLEALLWTMPVWILVAVDNRAPTDVRQPAPDAPGWLFDLQVDLLILIQLVNHVLLGVMASRLVVGPLPQSVPALFELGAVVVCNFLAVAVVSGTTAGYSGIVVAHELVHRRRWHQYQLGRLLLACTCYEHFATEHVRGHHPRIGTRNDPATARFGETFRQFFRRTVPQQFRSAWRLEKVRLGDPDMGLFDRRMLQHRVLQGVVAELAIVVAFYAVFGGVAAVFFVMAQNRSAIMLLEVVNYVEHWGLTRVGRKVTPLDSWDTDNWFTLHTLVGLSRHSDHHAQASRPYHALRAFGDSPKMPRGYYGTILMALLRNQRYIEAATAELKRRKLGPFREGAVASEPPARVESAGEALAATG